MIKNLKSFRIVEKCATSLGSLLRSEQVGQELEQV